MNNLTIGPDWGQQIARLRDRITEETHLIRWGNDFYRCCRPGAPITIELHSPDGGEALAMQMRPDDLYITQIAGHREMGRYGSLTGELHCSGALLSHAVHALSNGTAHGDKAFGLRSLVVFCVAESLRFDGLARDVGYTMLTGQNKVIGTETPLPLVRWWPTVHGWGQACDAIWASLDPQMRAVSLRPRSTLSGAQRSLSARCNYEAMTAQQRTVAKAIKTLKRPA